MNHWNTPVTVVSTIKKLVRPFFTNYLLTINYKYMVEELSQKDISNTPENHLLLDKVMQSIQDRHVDYHIMKLEGLLSLSVFVEETVPLREKMQKVYEQVDFEHYRVLYQTDINKKKDLFLETVRYVSSMQSENLLVLKYEKDVTFYDLWNEFYMEFRGVVIDLEDMVLVSAPYRKFFNYNEKPSTSAERIERMLAQALDVLIKNKEDGSMVSVTKYKNGIIVSTPGSMESSQAKWAKNFLFTHHATFLKEMPRHVTYLFEAIYPENRIVVDYQGQEKMVMTGIRSTLNGTYFPDRMVYLLAGLYNIPTPQTEYKSFSALLEEAKNKEIHPADKKEGWVITIQTAKDEVRFKLKCEDYCEIHKVIGVANSPKVVFEQIIQDTFDDFIAKVPDMVKPLAYDITNAIWEHIKQTEEKTKYHLSLIPKDLFFTKEEVEKSKELKRFVKEKIVPLIGSKLSKNKKTELEEWLLSKAFGKEPSIDKYSEKEFHRLWAMIPSQLQNQKSFRQKEGRLLGFVYKQLPSTYQSLALNAARGLEIDYLSLVDIKDIHFSFLKEAEYV